MKRRDFIKIAGLATGTAVVPGCIPDKDEIKLVSQLEAPPEGTIPGDPYFINTTCTECPAGCGISATLINGKVTKLEGLKGHPVNDGKTCIRGQASLTRLYSPSRLHYPMRRTSSGSYERVKLSEAYAAISRALVDASTSGRQSVYLASRTTGALSGLISEFCNQMGVRRAKEYEPFDYAALRKANQVVFGRYEVPSYNIEQSDFLLTVGADIVETFGSPVANARKLSEGKDSGKLRWAHVEPHISIELLNSDMRYSVRPGSEHVLLGFILRMVGHARGTSAGPGAQITPSQVAEATGLHVNRITRLAEDFAKAKQPLVIAGGASTTGPHGLEVAMLSALIQKATGAVGTVVDFASGPDYSRVGTSKDLAALADTLRTGRVGVIFVSRTDPVRSAPASIDFAGALDKAGLSVALVDPSAMPSASDESGMDNFVDATARQCDIILPLTHFLESWGDVEPKKGLYSVIRPVARPHVETASEGDILIEILKAAGRSLPAQTFFEPLVLSKWGGSADSEAVKKGFRTQAASANATSSGGVLASAVSFSSPDYGPEPVLVLAPSLRYYDGRSRPVYLLNEIPDPLTTVTHGEWVSISEDHARRLGVADGDVLALSTGDWSTKLPARIQPMLPDNVLLADIAFVPSPPVEIDLRTGGASLILPNIKATVDGAHVRLPIMSGSPSQEGRGIIPNPVHMKGAAAETSPEHSGAEAASSEHGDEHGANDHAHHAVTLYPEVHYPKYRWAMTIDLDKCTGCSACVAACYVENNLSMVGPEQHVRGREMSWIRIEPYYDREAQGSFIPMLCQQCGNAPCEAVCPVFAAYHNQEGLNAQIYNRCVGTRYCANNCPYKVRRFNWYDWDRHEEVAELNASLMLNPNVSRRGRGIMEKCTFCVHRIRQTKDNARDEGRDVTDGEMMPACAQACPSHAIVFGNIMDEASEVSATAKSERVHRVLEELGTEPAVRYLASIAREGEA